jgi:hypothetical protein
MNIVKKIKSLEYNLKQPYSPDYEKNIKHIEEEFDIMLPKEYKEFIREIGFIYIMSPVMIKSINPIPEVTTEKNLVSIGRFLDWSKGKFSIHEALESCSEQFPKGFIPFAEGESGDYIGFKNSGNNVINIYYWFHEGPIGSTLTLIANNFEALLSSLVIQNPEPTREKRENKSNLGPSPKMIELLKKTGKWKES